MQNNDITAETRNHYDKMSKSHNIANSDLASIAIKYRFLFGLHENSNILIIGEFQDSLVRDFERVFDCVVRLDDSDGFAKSSIGDARYDLVIVDGSWRPGGFFLEEVLRAVKQRLKTTGVLLIQAPNRFSIKSLKKMLKGYRGSKGLSAWKYRTLIKSAGFDFLQEYIVLPDFDIPEEYVCGEWSTVELRVDVRRLLKWLNRFGLYRYIHDGFLYLAAYDNANSFAVLINQLIGSVRETGVPEVKGLRVEKFYLRDRGALLLVLSSKHEAMGYVARIATSPAINSILSRNMEAVENIHNLSGISANTASKIPRVIKATKIHDAWVYFEEKKQGVLAWKLSGNRIIDRKFYEDAFDFIHRFNQETAKNVVVTDAVFEDLIGRDLTRIEMVFADQSLVDINKIRELFYAFFYGKNISVVIGHGDYGPGNILCNGSTGKLLAVIDWDTYVETELPAVDFINLVIQRCRKPTVASLETAIKELKMHISSSCALDESLGGYNNDDFGLMPKDLIVYLCVTVIRYIKRSLPYRKELDELAEEYIIALRIVREILESQQL